MDDCTRNFTIRTARVDDAPELLAIYSYYVLNSAASFELDPPSLEEFTDRITEASKKYPYFVIETEDRIAGFAFAHPFRERPAYDYAAETTIYLHPDERHKGYGKAIYSTLENALRDMGIRGIYACIAVPEGEDEFLRPDSPLFHEASGFRLCGTFKYCGYKFGKWYTMIWMEKIIGEFTENPEPIIPYREALSPEPAEAKALSFYDGKTVRVLTKSGDVFYGLSSCFHEEWGMHVLNREEAGVEVGVYSLFESDIENIAEV